MVILGLTFHHIGLAIKRDYPAIQFLKGLGYVIGEKVYDSEQNVYLRLCFSDNGPDIELIMPGEGDGPLTPILNRFNELVYHTCYEVENLKDSLESIHNAGLRILPLAEPKPAILFIGRNTSFYQLMGFGIIELIEP